ncbi:MAG TPA: imidazolonepropionase [Idiomarina abyssalis]|jgi:imidazolonepropionase|uniref:imidazolonepropionase n=1 Tax=Idiomarina TaxID=135575 RepID=UPI000C6189A4|nr:MULTISPECIES: imidazolonepropionase [Idiomarina]MBH93343.1 imidazolonepropionase [Idiomarina sp.]HAS15752.1 imidazolonepropionase [Idiomarina abyssalis]|tara:strand:+ start:488 stop:1714 length:1227 start_codon:yes stop_codon:yes gene_type:complete
MQRIENINAATMNDDQGYGLIHDATVIINKGKIEFVGAAFDAPATPTAEVIDGNGGLLTPGLIDCHTHLVWAGSRANEFAQRLHGASYQEIAEQGGGIKSTVKSTREASQEELLKLALERAETLMSQGVTSIEVKSGYGLDLENERKQLTVARQLAEQLPVNIKTTLLAAHAVPPEFKDNADGYIDEIIQNILPTLANEGLVDAVDAFCESIGFSPAQTEKVFEAAKKLRLPIKLHAEQITNQQGAKLAAEYQALSADHLEQLDEEGVKAMAENGTVAVLLPGAFYFLRDTQKPPVELLRKHGVPMAIATDANPGSSPIHNLPLMLQMAATFFHMTPEECLRGVTVNAAKALGEEKRGVIAEGCYADLALWNCQDAAELTYQFGVNPLKTLWFNGVAHDRVSKPWSAR